MFAHMIVFVHGSGRDSYLDLLFVCFSIADYDAFSRPTNIRAPSPTTVDFDQMPVSHWDARSADPMRSARRCLLRVVPGKGLGFVLSATGDYDHTITSVEKVHSIREKRGR
jgi:hypothetical protein